MSERTLNAMAIAPKEGYPIQHIMIVTDRGEFLAHWAYGGAKINPYSVQHGFIFLEIAITKCR